MKLKSRVEQLESNAISTSISAQNSCKALEQKYQSLSQQHIDLNKNYSSLYQEHQVLAVAFRTEDNKTAKLEKDVIALNTISDKPLAAANRSRVLEKDVAVLKQGQAVGKLQVIADLQNVTSKIQTDVNLLLSNSQNLNHSLDHLQTELVSLKTPVGFTAFGTSYGTVTAGTIIKFPNIASSFGLAGLSSFQSCGTFRAEKEGVYHIITTIMAQSSTSDTWFYLYKNNRPVQSRYYSGKSNTSVHSSITSGTGSWVLQLSVNDTVEVRTGHTMYLHKD